MTRSPTSLSPANHNLYVNGNVWYHAQVTTALPPTQTIISERLLRIQEVAEEVGLTPRSIRYYEERGLLRPAARSEGAYRLYDASDLEQLRFIKGLRDDAGLSIADIGQILEDEESRRRTRAALKATDDPAERRRILLERLASIEGLHGRLNAKLARLQAMFDDVEARRGRLHDLLVGSRQEVVQPASPGLDVIEHRLEACQLGVQAPVQSFDAGQALEQDPPPLGWVVGHLQRRAGPPPRFFVLKDLADVGYGQAGVVAKPLDEAKLLQVRGIVEAIGSLGPRGRPQEAALLVVANRARSEAGLLGHLLDAEEALGGAGLGSGQGGRHLGDDTKPYRLRKGYGWRAVMPEPAAAGPVPIASMTSSSSSSAPMPAPSSMPSSSDTEWCVARSGISRRKNDVTKAIAMSTEPMRNTSVTAAATAPRRIEVTWAATCDAWGPSVASWVFRACWAAGSMSACGLAATPPSFAATADGSVEMPTWSSLVIRFVMTEPRTATPTTPPIERKNASEAVTTPSRSTGKAFWTTIVKSAMDVPRPIPRTTMLRTSVALSVAAVI